MEETLALKFPINQLQAMTDANARLLRALARLTSRRLYHAQHMRSLSIEDVAGRVACALIYLQDEFGDEIPHSRATLAEVAGTTVESAIRATRSLRLPLHSSRASFLVLRLRGLPTKMCIQPSFEINQDNFLPRVVASAGVQQRKICKTKTAICKVSASLGIRSLFKP